MVYRQALSIMPSEEGPTQKVQRQLQDPATIGDVVDFTDMRLLGDKDKLFDTQQSVRNCASVYNKDLCVSVCVVHIMMYFSANQCVKK